MYYDKHYNEKPSGYEVGVVQKSLKPTEIDIKDLAQRLSHGCTFKPELLTGTKSKDFVSQEVFALDFDDGITIDKALTRCEKLNLFPVFGYKSFSHKPEHHKFRLVFHCNKVITDIDVRNKIQLSLMAAFPECDIKCKDISRLFFGGRQLLCENYDAVFDSDDIISRFYKEPIEQREQKTDKPKYKLNRVYSNPDKKCNEHIEAIRKLDVKAMRELLGITKTEKTNYVPKLDFRFVFDNNEIYQRITNAFKSLFGTEINDNNFKIGIEQIPELFKEVLKDGDKLPFDIEITEKDGTQEIEKFCDKHGMGKERIKTEETENPHRPPAGVLGGSDKEESSSISSPLNPSNLIFSSYNDLYKHINSLDLAEYLGVGDGMFKCIRPIHEDSKPSAHIYISDDGTPVYKCFGCGLPARGIITMTEELSGCKRHEAINFIKDVYRLEVKESDWVREQRQILYDSIAYLDTDEFKETFPELEKRIRSRKLHIQKIMTLFAQHITESLRIGDRPAFFASYKQLLEACNLSSNRRDKLAETIGLFTLLDILDKIPESKIPERELNKAKLIAATYKQKKIVNFYQVEDCGLNTLTDSEGKAKVLKQNNVRLGGISREMVQRTFGIEEANRVFPQYVFENERGLSEKSQEFTLEIGTCIMDLINKNGYATESQVINALQKYHKPDAIKLQLKRCLQDVLNTYLLKRVQCNKQLKEQYEVDGKGFPLIMIRDEQYEDNSES